MMILAIRRHDYSLRRTDLPNYKTDPVFLQNILSIDEWMILMHLKHKNVTVLDHCRAMRNKHLGIT